MACTVARSRLPLLALALTAATALAAVAPQRPQFVVDTSTYYSLGLFHGPDVATNAAGEFVVVWEQLYGNYYGERPGIFGRRFDSLGRQLGPQFTVNGPSYQGSGRSSPAVASSPAGTFVVVWQEYPYLYGDYESGIVARRFQGGVAQGPPFLVNAPTGAYETNPKVAADAAGNFVVVWTHYNSGSYFIKAQRFDSIGAPIAGEFQVNVDTSCCPGSNVVDEDPDGIEVAADPAGGFMVVWERFNADGDGHGIVGRAFDSSGAPLGGEFQVNVTTADAQTLPAITVDGADRFVVTWHSDAQGVVARRFTTSGAPLGGELQVSSSPAPLYLSGSKVSASATDGFVVVWPVYDEIRGREFDSAGVPVGGEFQVHDALLYPSGDKRTPAIAVGTPGTFTVVWADYNQYRNGWDVVGRRLGPAPVPCAPAPMTGCREPTIPGRGVLRYKANANPARSTLLWRWVRGEAASIPDFGDPFTTDSYAFCLYDGTGAVFTAVAPAGGACGSLPCWRTLGGGRVDYFDRARFADGLEGIRLTPGTDGAARAQVKGKGSRLVLPTTALTPPVTAQLQGANGECWSAEYDSGITENLPGAFRANPGP